MPLTVNVGMSRKSSQNYQSAGVSINLTAELDQSLLADPPRLQQEIDRVYLQAQTALDRQAAALSDSRTPQEPRPCRNSLRRCLQLPWLYSPQLFHRYNLYRSSKSETLKWRPLANFLELFQNLGSKVLGRSNLHQSSTLGSNV